MSKQKLSTEQQSLLKEWLELEIEISRVYDENIEQWRQHEGFGEEEFRPRFSRYYEIANYFLIHKCSVVNYGKRILSENDRAYRTIRAQSQNSKKNGLEICRQGKGLFALSKEQLQEQGRKSGRIQFDKGKGIHAMTREQRQEVSRNLWKEGIGLASLTTMQRQEISRNNGLSLYRQGKGIHAMTREQRQEVSRNLWKEGIGLASLTTMQRQEIGKKSYEKNLASLTNEQRKEIGKNSMSFEQRQKHGKMLHEQGKGIHAMTREQRQEIGRIVYSEGKGIASITKEQRQKISKKSAELLRKNRYPFKGNCYDSQSEAACGVLMEKYLPGFKVVEKESFQVNRDIPKTIDFLVESAFVEWHPTMLFRGKNGLGDIPTWREYQSYKRVVERLSPEEKKQFKQDYSQYLANVYLIERQNAISQSQRYRSLDLILIRDSGELYDRVITRFAQPSALPSRQEFISEFNRVKTEVKNSKVKIKSD